ncbi:MAG: SRPBCC family protein [Acidobacteriales bacterium]|nr:SRPBCC family protein [Terriglobales bacterium]
MGNHYEYRLEVPGKPAQAFAVLTDWEAWRHSTVWGDIQWIEGEPWQPGSRRRMEALVPFRYSVEQKILHFSAPQTFTAVTHGYGFTNTITFWLQEARQDTTRIEIQLDMAGVTATLFGVAIDQLISRFMEAYVKELRERCVRAAG